MAYSYKGTKITGVSTNAKKFKKSGIKKAKKGQTYLNTQTGHVYSCTDGGKASDAKWKYTKTAIIKKPNVAVANFGAPTRDGYKLKATWKKPSGIDNAKSGSRATGYEVSWSLGCTDGTRKMTSSHAISSTGSELNLASFKYGSAALTRKSFYPVHPTRKLTSATCSVTPKNTKGKGSTTTSQKLTFEKPAAPSIGAFSLNAATGIVSVTIETAAPSSGGKERYDIVWKLTVKNTLTGKTSTSSDTTTSGSFTLRYDCSNYMNLSYDQYIQLTVEATARGYAGDTKASKTWYVSYPGEPSISDVEISSTDSTGKCTVYVSTGSTTEHPCDQIRLEYLPNTVYSEANQIPGDASWEPSEIIDNANCSAMAIAVGSLIPDRGKYTWIRIKSHHANEAVLYRYSNYVRVEDLELPAASAADDYIDILSTKAGGDGKSIVVLLGWDKDGHDDATGTELTWSEEMDAWKSTEDPDDYTFTWSDPGITWEGVHYNKSAEITIKKLNENTLYYIMARRYLEGDTTEYSPYSKMESCLTSEKPETIVASCEKYVPTGASLPVYWTFSGNGIQTKWQIMSSDGVTVAEGKGSIGSTQISAQRLADCATNGSLTFTVQAATGNDFVISEPHTIVILDKPTLTINVPATLTTQPFTFTAHSSRLCNLVVIVSGDGASGQRPEGVMHQMKEDTIYSAIMTPTWTQTEGVDGYDASITLPTKLDFWDKCRYKISVVAIDRETELRTEEVPAEFQVNWAHQAVSAQPIDTYILTEDTSVVADKGYFEYDAVTQTYVAVDPEGTENPAYEGWYEVTTTNYVTLTPIDMVDDDGMHHKSVQINLTPPPGAFETDTYDIYRLTGDGPVLIGEEFPLTHETVDEYAPFGEDMTLHYRIATKTADGDVAWCDLEYVADDSMIRFDWANNFLELPYNLSIADKYKKDAQLRYHMDGSVDGYWNSNIERKGTYSSDLIRLEQQSDIDKARQLARYPGAVFVRTPDGSAFEADVQVTDLSTEGNLSTIAIDANEIGLTGEFMLPIPRGYENESESGESNAVGSVDIMVPNPYAYLDESES